ncbi:hypothetical protein FOA52_009561 [Chlamydomonas sp. UWO 241]|nr:hypothetical protein FOA52_009561 [Chlamydomonas sp. UWO 241]
MMMMSSRTLAFGAVAPRVQAAQPLGRGNLQVACAYGTTPKVGGGKRWKHIEVNDNGKPVKVDMHVKKGDLVKVIAGADKGKTGTIIKVVTGTGKVSVEGVNIRTKHIAPRSENETGSIKKSEYPIHHSNVQLYSKEKEISSRVAYKVDEASGKKVRVLIKTGEVLP